MRYKDSDRILIRTNYKGYITTLGTSGPIVNPLAVTVADAIRMILNGLELFQVDPSTKKTVKLTAGNVYDANKFGKPVEVTYQTGRPITVESRKGIVPPAQPAPAQVFAPNALVGEEGPSEVSEQENEKGADELGESVADSLNTQQQHLSKSQRRKLARQQRAAANAATAPTSPAEEDAEVAELEAEEAPVEETSPAEE